MYGVAAFGQVEYAGIELEVAPSGPTLVVDINSVQGGIIITP